MAWKQVESFADVKVGDRVRLVRPRTVLPPEDDGEPEEVISEAAYEGVAENVNSRGQIKLEGHYVSFLEDGTFGDWFYEIYVDTGTETA